MASNLHDEIEILSNALETPLSIVKKHLKKGAGYKELRYRVALSVACFRHRDDHKPDFFEVPDVTKKRITTLKKALKAIHKDKGLETITRMETFHGSVSAGSFEARYKEKWEQNQACILNLLHKCEYALRLPHPEEEMLLELATIFRAFTGKPTGRGSCSPFVEFCYQIYLSAGLENSRAF